MRQTVFLIALLMVCSSVFAGGSTNKKDKIYADCLVNVPKVCGGASNVDWENPIEAKKFRDCTAIGYKKCYNEKLGIK